ncbi:MAG: HAMP domain-containing sensor histidine kinase [Pseudomonadota bacterium]
MIQNLTRSLSFRLLAIFLAMGALFAYGAVLGIRWVYLTDDLRDLVSGHLALHVNYVKDDIGNPPRIENALAISQKVPVDIRITGPSMDWASDPNFPPIDDLSFGTSDVFSDAADAWLGNLEEVEFAQHDAHGFLKILQGDYAVVVSTPKIADTPTERQLTPIILGFGLFLVLLAYLAVRWLFKPIGAIRWGAAQIGRGNFEHRIADIRKDQLGDLANDINLMAGDVQNMLDAKRQLLLGISHELRSPLSRMNLGLELLEESDDVAGLRGDVQEMEKIISTLLEAERLHGRHVSLQIAPVSINILIDNLIENFFSSYRHQMRVKAPPETVLNIDEARVTLMLKNLLSNALRYSSDSAEPISIEVTTDKHSCKISVADHGPGIAPAQAAFIGEPFHRADPSRTRGTGGTGLGLYLVKTIAQAHGGTLELDQTYLEGARFIIRLPLGAQPR